MSAIDYTTVPVDYMAGAVQRYVEHGIEPGSFMKAILAGDLYGAVNRADGMNVARIPSWVVWISENLPPAAYGSYQAYVAWVTVGGLNGMNEESKS